MNGFAHFEQRASSAVQPKPNFVHKARHDIRGAMHVVIGMSKVLVLSGDLSPAQKDVIDTLKRNADHALELVENLCDYLEPPNQKATLDEDESMQQILIPDNVAASLPDKNRRVLLVEDSVANAALAAAFLKELGYECDFAESGISALQRFSTSSYSAIIMDVQMPGMDGLETTRRIRALEKKRNIAPTPILATTGNATDDDKFFCIKAGMNDYLSKPFDIGELESKLCAVEHNPGSTYISQRSLT